MTGTTITITLGDKESADHEAGHFVVGRLLDFPWIVYYATIERGIPQGFGRQDGRISGGGIGVDFKGYPDPDDYGVYQMAGMAAMRKALRLKYGAHVTRQLEKLVQLGGMGDFDGFREYLKDGQEWAPCMRRAHGILDCYWPAVERLSQELLKERTLFHEESRLIVDAVLHNQPVIFRYLEVYRRFRRPMDTSLIPKDFLKAQPDFKWPETFGIFRDREGCPDLDRFDDWYDERMYPKPDPIPSKSLARELAEAAYDEAKNRLKAKVRSLLPW